MLDERRDRLSGRGEHGQQGKRQEDESECRQQSSEVGGQAVLGRQLQTATPWLTERHGYDPTSLD